jgi:hypothetical protein
MSQSAALKLVIGCQHSDVLLMGNALYDELTGATNGVYQTADVPYDPTNFFGTGALTWTVDLADQATFSFQLIAGKLMTLELQLNATTIGGTVAGNNLQVKIPNGLLAAKTVAAPCLAAPAGAATEDVIASLTAGSNIITILRNAANWVVGANNTSVNLLLTFPIQ